MTIRTHRQIAGQVARTIILTSLCSCIAVPAVAQVVSGRYDGNGGATAQVDQLGFQPDVVIVKGSNIEVGAIRTSTMAGDATKPMTGATGLTAGLVQSLDARGFTVGNGANTNLVQYHFIAFKQAASRMKVGTYQGNGVSGRPIGGVGFSPELVIVMSAAGAEAIFRSSATTNNESFNFGASAGSTLWISGLTADGFTVSNNSRVNANGTWYHYVAWNEVPGVMDVGIYTGTGTDGTNIGGPLFRPEYVIVKRDGASDAVHRPASVGPTADTSKFFTNASDGADRIQQLTEDGFQVGSAAVTETNVGGGVYHYFAWRRTMAQMQVLSGSYTGNGGDNRAITGVGFQPDAVLIKAADTSQPAVMRYFTAYGDFSGTLTGITGPNMIQSLDLDGFTVGTNATVNSTGVTYNWVAWQCGAGQMEVGLYQGNGVNGRTIAELGFAPDFVIVAGTLGEAVYRNSAGTTSYNFTGNSGATWITALGVDGFTVSNDAHVNGASDYAWVAWNEIPGVMDVGSYTGTGGDDRNVTGVGFLPQFVMTQSTAPGTPVAHSLAMGTTTDASHYFNSTANAADHIQALQTDGFQVGTSAQSNASSTTYVYAAWAANTITAVGMVRMSANRTKQGVTLEWRTGYEASNLGFHIYRERQGERERLTTAPVKGAALLLGPASEQLNGFSYRWTDTSAGTEAITYWIEDLDLDGTSTMHGPVVAREESRQVFAGPAFGWLSLVSRGTPAGSAKAPAPRKVAAPAGKAIGAAASSSAPPAAGTPKAAVIAAAPGGPVAPAPAGQPPVPVPPSPAPHLLRSAGVDDGHQSAGRGRQTSTPEMQAQWRLARGPAARLRVRTAGWYEVSQPQLIAAGIDAATDPRRLKLFVNGLEQPLIVRGESDGRFDAADGVGFYAEGTDTPYTDSRIYWLAAGDGPGARIAAIDAAPRNTASPASFASTVERKDRTIYFAALLNGEAENFFGELVSGDTVAEQTLQVPHLDREAARAARLEVRLQGVTDDPGNGNHEVTVRLNGRAVGTVTFAGREQASAAWEIDVGWLVDGENIVGLKGSSEFDYTLVDAVRLTYMRFYAPDDHRLRSTAEAGSDVVIGPFDDAGIRLFDVTDTVRPVELAGSIESQAAGFVVRATVAGSGTRSLLAFTPRGVLAPAEVTANAPSTWHRAAAGADVVVISHAAFMPGLQPLERLRAEQGHRVAVVDVEDVYDEFSFGEKTPFALRRFLAQTYRRTAKARHVLLVGNATNDPRDYYAIGEPDFVPTKMVMTTALEAASDDWFVDADGDRHAELGLIGRLPVRSPEETAVIVGKILDYERGGADAWTKSVLLVAEPAANGDFDYQAASAALKPLIPPDYAVASLDSPRVASTRDEVVARFNEGHLLVNFVGHGSVEEWGGSLLSRDDVPALTNGPRLPFMVAMNCLNGLFNSLFPEESIAESLLRAPNGGAIAVWASSSVTSPQWQALMNRELLRQLFGGRTRSAGEAVAAAKRAVSDPDVRQSWILFGDPLTRLKGVSEGETSRQTPDPPGHSPVEPPPMGDAGSNTESAAALLARAVDQRLADFNADGFEDLLLHDAVAGQWRVAFNKGTRFELSAPFEGVSARPYPARLNDDSLMDVFWYDARTGVWTQALNQGEGTFVLTSGAWLTDWKVLVADFDGDARSDVFLHKPDTGEWFQYFSDGTGGFGVRAGAPLPAGVVRVVNLNGDAAADLLVHDASSGGWMAAVSRGQGQFAVFPLRWDPGLHAQPGDLNGDGWTDFVLWHPGSLTWTEAVSRAPGRFVYRQHTRATGGLPHLADLNGDRREDVIWYDGLSGAWSVQMSGSSGVPADFTGRWGSGWEVVSGDLDADDGTDLLLYNPPSGIWVRVSLTPDGVLGTLTGAWTGQWSVLGTRR